MNILILGSTGFLGKNILHNIKDLNCSISESSRDEFISKDGFFFIADSLKRKLNQSNICINCIADTNFMSCEQNQVKSIPNILIPKAISNYANEKTYLIHISSDIFYENLENNSDELSKLSLNNNYAIQKASSETFFKEKNSLILRTSFLGYNHRNIGLLNHICNTLHTNKKFGGWSNVISSSVSINNLVSLIKKIIHDNIQIHGIYNFGTLEPYSKYEYIHGILKLFNREELVCKTNYAADLYERNINSGMSSEKIKQKLGIRLPEFEDIISDGYNDVNTFVKR